MKSRRRVKSPCKSGKIRNPRTGRCVKKDGKIGKLIRGNIRRLKSKSTRHRKREPICSKLAPKATPPKLACVDLMYTSALIQQIIPPNRRVGENIGSGNFGNVYKVCDAYNPNHCTGALKFQKTKIDPYRRNSKEINTKMILSEIYMQNTFYLLGIAPKIYAYEMITTNNNLLVSAIYMERLDTTLELWLKSKKRTQTQLTEVLDGVIKLMDIMCENDITQGDFHAGNIALRYDQTPSGEQKIELMVLDFGWASVGSCFPLLDLIQLYRGLNFHEKDINANSVQFSKGVKKITNYLFPNIQIPFHSQSQIEKLFCKLHEEYRDNQYNPFLEMDF